VNAILVCCCCSQVFERYHIFERFIIKNKLWPFPTFWWRDTTIYWVSSVYTSRPTSLLACVLTPTILKPSTCYNPETVSPTFHLEIYFTKIRLNSSLRSPFCSFKLRLQRGISTKFPYGLRCFHVTLILTPLLHPTSRSFKNIPCVPLYVT
jgi:hypothetical protein